MVPFIQELGMVQCLWGPVKDESLLGTVWSPLWVWWPSALLALTMGLLTKEVSKGPL